MSHAADMAPVSQDNSAEFEVRGDEEQKVKLTQTVELLLAAGYFRARIKGLSPFDKVVGGMTWCISTCSYDIDVDLLFQENSSIGQKISLTEKIVGALKRMKCPHRIEPHQIQGLDFIHIFPVVQWLVKRALETRQEMGDYIRAFSISQFNKHHALPQDIAFDQNKDKSITTINLVKTVYQPQRKYRRQDMDQILEEEARVQSTLLEYGRQYGLSRATDGDQNSSKKMTDEEKEKEERSAEEEERYIESLMKGMAFAGRKESKLSAQSVSSIVNLQSNEIQQFAAEYAEKQPKRDQLEKGAGGVQHHHRLSAALKKQIDQQEAKKKELSQKHEEERQAYNEQKENLQKAADVSKKLDEEQKSMVEIEEQSEQKQLLDKLRHLVTLNKKLKKQEIAFRENCKEEMERLQTSIDELKKGQGVGLQDEEHALMIDQQFQSNREKLQNIRRLLGKRNREIAALQRRIDEVPTRAELSQYQCRFVELYNQVAAKHKETKQFFTLYNTLDDTRMYLSKEVNLLNSISDTFEQAMSSPSNREQFLKQFEQIVEGVKQNRAKVERRKQEEKMKRDELNDRLLEYLEKQRLYFKTVKDFQEECRKNEILLSKLH